MLVRKKYLKVQERLGMRIGLMDGTIKIPAPRKYDEVVAVMRDIYNIGLRAYVIPREFFSGIKSVSDIYTTHYANLLKIRDMASKYDIELSLHFPELPEQPDEILKVYTTICSVIGCRIFFIRPDFYKRMPKDQAHKLVVYKINEIVSGLDVKPKIGIETTGRIGEVGSLEEVIDIVKRTQNTEVVINWANVHARGSGALRSGADFNRVFSELRAKFGPACLQNVFGIFSGASYGPSGLIKQVPISRSDMKIEHLVDEIMGFNAKGTLIIDDPGRERFCLDLLKDLADMVR